MALDILLYFWGGRLGNNVFTIMWYFILWKICQVFSGQYKRFLFLPIRGEQPKTAYL